MKDTLKIILSATVICGVLCAVGYCLWRVNKTPYGVEIPGVTALFETSLSSKIASGSTTMTLVSGTTKDATTLNGKFGFIIDEGGSDEEFVIADCVDTACTGMLRGISVVDGQTETDALKKPHRRGASVKMTNYPILGLLQRLASGSVGYDDLLYYTETIGTTGFSGTASTSNFATKYYVDEVGAGGFTAANVETSDGLVALGTSPETVGINLASTSGLYFESGGDLAIYASSAFNTIMVDDDGMAYVGSGAMTFTDITAGSITITTPLDELYGGTGAGSWIAGDLLYASATNTIARLASASEDWVLTMADGFPAWVAADLTVVSKSFTAEIAPSGDTNENVIYTATIDANTLGANETLRLTLKMKVNSGAYHSVMKIKLGSTTLATIGGDGGGEIIYFTLHIANRNATGSQIIVGNGLVDTTATTSYATATEDTTGALDITVTNQRATTGGAGSTFDYFLLEKL